jgi:hypothetical protein
MFAGNFFDANIQMGIYDADFGGLYSIGTDLKVNKSTFRYLPISGQVRKIRKIRIKGKEAFLLVRNNDKLIVLAQKALQ